MVVVVNEIYKTDLEDMYLRVLLPFGVLSTLECIFNVRYSCLLEIMMINVLKSHADSYVYVIKILSMLNNT